MAKKSPRVRRTFNPQFKKDAVALVEGGRSVNEVAHDLGIARSLLQRWRTQLRREPEAAFPGTGRLREVHGKVVGRNTREKPGKDAMRT
jgi:transposase